jgi:hypothetical protein
VKEEAKLPLLIVKAANCFQLPQLLSFIPSVPACRFAATDASVVDQFNDSDAFGQLLGAATRVSEQHTEMPGADIAAMYIALANFVGAVYPDHLDHIDRVLQSCHEVDISSQLLFWGKKCVAFC